MQGLVWSALCLGKLQPISKILAQIEITWMDRSPGCNKNSFYLVFGGKTVQFSLEIWRKEVIFS